MDVPICSTVPPARLEKIAAAYPQTPPHNNNNMQSGKCHHIVPLYPSLIIPKAKPPNIKIKPTIANKIVNTL